MYLETLNLNAMMTKREVNKHARGSAAYVIAHAAWRKSRGRKPSLPYLDETNPRQALTLARRFCTQLQLRRLNGKVGKIVTALKTWSDMTEQELRASIRGIVQTSYTEQEICERIREEIACPYVPLVHLITPEGVGGIQARDIGQALGGLVTAAGQMAMLTLRHVSGNTLYL